MSVSKRLYWLLPIVALLVMGMGEMGLSGDDTPSRPSHNFTGTVTDRSLVSLHIIHIHCEGKTVIKAYLGEMTVKLPFEKIEKIDFYPGSSSHTFGNVQLRSGESKKMRFKSTVRCYGDSEYGQIMVRVKDLKRIEFDAPPPDGD